MARMQTGIQTGIQTSEKNAEAGRQKFAIDMAVNERKESSLT